MYPLPKREHPTDANGSSSSPGLPTPTANVSGRTGEQHMAMRESIGRATPSQLEAAVQLLPTPAAGNFNDGESLESWEARRQLNLAKGINGNGQGTPLAMAIQLLKTPTAQLAVNGGSQHPDKRREGGHGPTLADQVECELLPTPRATDGTKWGPGQSATGGDSLPTTVMDLLPTPRAQDAKHAESSQNELARDTGKDLLHVRLARQASSGEPTSPPSAAGKPPPAAAHPRQLSLDELDSD